MEIGLKFERGDDFVLRLNRDFLLGTLGLIKLARRALENFVTRFPGEDAERFSSEAAWEQTHD